MRKVQLWFLSIISISFMLQMIVVIALSTLTEKDLKLWKSLGVGFSLIDLFIVFISLLVFSSTVKEKDYFSTYDELQKRSKEADEELKMYKNAREVLGNHFVMKHFIDNSGFRQMRNRYIYKRKK